MASTTDRLAVDYLGELHKSATFLHHQVHTSWAAARTAETSPLAVALAKALTEAADAVAETEARLLDAIRLASPATPCWCGASASHLNPASDASDAHRACPDHVKEGAHRLSKDEAAAR